MKATIGLLCFLMLVACSPQTKSNTSTTYAQYSNKYKYDIYYTCGSDVNFVQADISKDHIDSSEFYCFDNEKQSQLMYHLVKMNDSVFTMNISADPFKMVDDFVIYNKGKELKRDKVGFYASQILSTQGYTILYGTLTTAKVKPNGSDLLIFNNMNQEKITRFDVKGGLVGAYEDEKYLYLCLSDARSTLYYTDVPNNYILKIDKKTHKEIGKIEMPSHYAFVKVIFKDNYAYALSETNGGMNFVVLKQCAKNWNTMHEFDLKKEQNITDSLVIDNNNKVYLCKKYNDINNSSAKEGKILVYDSNTNKLDTFATNLAYPYGFYTEDNFLFCYLSDEGQIAVYDTNTKKLIGKIKATNKNKSGGAMVVLKHQ